MSQNDIKIICVGAATQDVFLTGKVLTAKRDVREASYVEQFPLGAKLTLDNVYFDTGGGATNAAVTFARQGLRAVFMGKIGHDPAGAEVIRVLRKEGVGTDHVAYDAKQGTSYSTLLLAPNGERTILNYRGASHNLSRHDFNIKSLSADWLYVSSLAGNFDLLGRLLKHAQASGIKVALNPGGAEIAGGRKLRKLLPLVEVLTGNREEMQQIFGGDDAKQVMTHAFGVCPYIIMTDGPEGTYATDSLRIYQAGVYQNVKVVDRTGSGDAFASGLVAALARGQAIEDAITLASANATSVVQTIGAKSGILRTGRLRRMKVKAISL